MNKKKHIKELLKKKLLKDFLVNIKKCNLNFNLEFNYQFEGPSTIDGVSFSMPLSLGAFTHINPNGFIQNCTIGRYCAIGTGVKIGNGEHPTNWLSINACQYIENFHDYDNIFKNKICRKDFTCYKHTNIGNDVWIGANVFIKDGIKIGNGAVIGANSVVTHDVEPYAIVAGTPAKIIRYRFSKEIIEQLEELKWWEYNISDFGAVDFNNIELAIEQLKKLLPTLDMYKPKVINSDYLAKIIPTKCQLFGLIKTYKYDNKKIKKLCGIKLYEKIIQEDV